jgi:predicted ATP-dependent serine protease
VISNKNYIKFKIMQNPIEKEYPCPSCDEDKPDFRGECPDCGYTDKKLGNSSEKGGAENGN